MRDTGADAYSERERELILLTSAKPWDADLMLRLGCEQASLVKYPQAADSLRRAIVLAPDDPRPWIEYANLSVHLHEGEAATDSAYHRAAKLAGGNPNILKRVIDYFFNDAKPDIALHYLEGLLTANRSALEDPQIQKRYVASLAAAGRSDAAHATCRALNQASTTAAGMVDRARAHQFLVQRAVLLQAAGLVDEIKPCLEDCATRVGAFQPDFDGHPGALPNSAERVEALRQQISGRDVFALFPGPSASAFVERAEFFADWDFVSAVIAGHIETVEDAMLTPIGRRADILLASNPGHVRCAEEAIVAALERTSGIALLAQSYAFTGYPRRDWLLERFAGGMLWVHCGYYPPLPSAPLQFTNANSLAMLLPCLIWAEPKRIFLFGLDGGAQPPQAGSKPYFYAPEPIGEGIEAERDNVIERLEIMTLTQPRIEDAHRRFRLEAKEADDVIAMSISVLQTLFSLNIPEIYNCCPYSSHEGFPKITVDEALSLKTRLNPI